MHVLSEATPLTSTGIMDLRIVGFRSRLHNHNDRHALQIYAYSVSWLGVELWGGGVDYNRNRNRWKPLT